MTDNQKNVLGENLEDCSLDPLTGWYRDGCCKTDENDKGVHTVCAKVNDDFLNWCKEAGNDLVTPHPEFGFPGLKNGDSWCVCAGWFARAVDAGKGCPVYLKRTHEKTLKLIPIEILKKSAFWGGSTAWKQRWARSGERCAWWWSGVGAWMVNTHVHGLV